MHSKNLMLTGVILGIAMCNASGAGPADMSDYTYLLHFGRGDEGGEAVWLVSLEAGPPFEQRSIPVANLRGPRRMICVRHGKLYAVHHQDLVAIDLESESVEVLQTSILQHAYRDGVLYGVVDSQTPNGPARLKSQFVVRLIDLDRRCFRDVTTLPAEEGDSGGVLSPWRRERSIYVSPSGQQLGYFVREAREFNKGYDLHLLDLDQGAMSVQRLGVFATEYTTGRLGSWIPGPPSLWVDEDRILLVRVSQPLTGVGSRLINVPVGIDPLGLKYSLSLVDLVTGGMQDIAEFPAIVEGKRSARFAMWSGKDGIPHISREGKTYRVDIPGKRIVATSFLASLYDGQVDQEMLQELLASDRSAQETVELLLSDRRAQTSASPSPDFRSIAWIERSRRKQAVLRLLDGASTRPYLVSQGRTSAYHTIVWARADDLMPAEQAPLPAGWRRLAPAGSL